jgi:hypothetical protein
MQVKHLTFPSTISDPGRKMLFRIFYFDLSGPSMSA